MELYEYQNYFSSMSILSSPFKVKLVLKGIHTNSIHLFYNCYLQIFLLTKIYVFAKVGCLLLPFINLKMALLLDFYKNLKNNIGHSRVSPLNHILEEFFFVIIIQCYYYLLQIFLYSTTFYTVQQGK